MKSKVASMCIYNRKGMCYLLVSAPEPCRGVCVNFASVHPKLLRDLKTTKPVVTFYDLITSDPRYRAMFPRSGRNIQLSLLYSGTEELPEDEE